jgi:hypothetical protein
MSIATHPCPATRHASVSSIAAHIPLRQILTHQAAMIAEIGAPIRMFGDLISRVQYRTREERADEAPRYHIKPAKTGYPIR